MGKKYIFILTAVLLLLHSTTNRVYGQNEGTNRLADRVNDIRIQGGCLIVDFDILLRTDEVPSVSQMVLTPVIESPGGMTRDLPSVLVNGKRRHNLHRRMQKLDRAPADNPSIYAVVRTGEQKIHYTTTIPYEQWMNRAEVYLHQDLCGCGGAPQEISDEVLGKITLPEVPVFTYTYVPHVSFTAPPREEIKRRAESGTAHIVFPVNRAEIRPDLSGNRTELAKIEESLAVVKSEPTAEITGVTITAYASPEGTEQSNLTLSQKRAGALRDYVARNYAIPRDLISAVGQGEDWDGLQELAADDESLEDRDEILRIIRSAGTPDQREKRLKELSEGRPYQYMLGTLFPRLRRSEYRVDYTVPSFTVERGKELIRTSPALLSLEEMYLIAHTYEQGSDGFNEAILIAADVYPGNPVAGINAAGVYLLQGETEQAAAILEKYREEPAAWNNMGVLYMSQYRFEEAGTFLEKAKGYGDDNAVKNLVLLKEMRGAVAEYEQDLEEYNKYSK